MSIGEVIIPRFLHEIQHVSLPRVFGGEGISVTLPCKVYPTGVIIGHFFFALLRQLSEPLFLPAIGSQAIFDLSSRVILWF